MPYPVSIKFWFAGIRDVYYVSVENGAGRRYTATIISWPNCVAKGKTREEVIARVKQNLSNGSNRLTFDEDILTRDVLQCSSRLELK